MIDGRQVALAHTVDKALKWQVGNPHQTEMTVFAIQQTPGHGLVEVLEPVHTDDRRLAQRLLEEVRVGRAPVLFLRQLRYAAPERATVRRTEVEFGNQHWLVEAVQLREVITVLGFQGVHVEAQHIAVLSAGLHGFWRADGKAATEQHLVRRVPFERIRDRLEVGVGEDLLEVFEVGLDFRMVGAWQRRLETGVFHQFPCRQINAPGFRQAFLVAVFIAQLLEKRAFGRHVGGHFQRTVGQGVAGLRIVAGAGPGQFIVGVEADQPRIVAVIASGNGHGALGGHGETRVERIGHTAPPVRSRADARVIADDR